MMLPDQAVYVKLLPLNKYWYMEHVMQRLFGITFSPSAEKCPKADLKKSRDHVHSVTLGAPYLWFLLIRSLPQYPARGSKLALKWSSDIYFFLVLQSAANAIHCGN